MIKRCFDYRRIKKLMIYDMLVSDTVYYLVEEEDGVDLGVWHFHDWRDGAMIHVSMTEACRGKKARDSGKAALRWIFENTGFTKIYAMLPLERCAAQFMAVLIGMRFLYADTHRYYIAEA